MNVTSITLVYVLAPVIIILLYNRYDWVKKVGTVIMAYAVGIIMALCGLIPTGDAVGAEQMDSISKTLMNLMVPLAIPLITAVSHPAAARASSIALPLPSAVHLLAPTIPADFS